MYVHMHIHTHTYTYIYRYMYISSFGKMIDKVHTTRSYTYTHTHTYTQDAVIKKCEALVEDMKIRVASK
jgi:hypothetical protein